MAFKITATDATVFDTNQIDNVASAFKTALSLDQVTNLSDANLPISTAQQAAFDGATYSSTVNELAARKPSLNFNFAEDKSYTRDRTNLNGTLITSRSGPPLSFYRNSAATFVDSDGLIKYAPENLLLYSESFSAAAVWDINQASINVNATTAPDGISSADKLVETIVDDTHWVSQNIGAVPIGSTYTLSVYAKAGERTSIALTSVNELLLAVFNLSAGTVTTGGSAASIVAAGNGWYRCSATFTNTTGIFYLLPYTSTDTYIGTAGSGLYIWGAQVERGSVARTYLSTSTAVNTLAENLILFPNSFSNDYWNKTAAVSVTDGNTIGPFSVSTNDATKLTETTGPTVWRHFHELTGNFAPLSGQTYTMSIYVKADATWSNNYLQLAFWSAGFGNSAFKNYDITTKTVSTFVQDGATNIIASGIDTLSNGWLRIWATSTATATGQSGFQLALVPALTAGRTAVASNAQYTRTSAYQSVYIYGAQVVVGDATVSLAWPSSAAVYGPRFDHNPAPLTSVNLYGVSITTGENLFLNSSNIAALTGSQLARSSISAVTSGGGSPYWKLNADTTATSNHRLDQTTTTLLSRSSVMTVSAYVKAAEYSGFAIGQGNGYVGVAFSLLSNGSVTYSDTANGWSGAVTAPDANGFIRCSATLKASTYITAVAGRVNFFVGIAGGYSTGSTGNFTYTSAAGSGIYIKNIQIESNLRAADYNATSGSAIVGSLLSSNTKRCKGLLVEDQRTNNVTRSQEINLWGGSGGSTRAVSAENSPDGGVTKGALASGGAGGYGDIVARSLSNLTAVISTQYTVSCFVKKINYRYVCVDYSPIRLNGANVPFFDLDTLEFNANGSTVTGSITSYPNGWYRLTVSGAAVRSEAANVDIILCSASGGAGASRVGEQIYLWGAQLEAGPIMTSYIPTYSSEAERAADFAGISGADFTKFYNNSEGTFIVAADATRMGSVGYGNKSILAIGKAGTYEAVSGISKANGENNIYSFVNSGYAYVNPNTFTSTALTNSSAFKATLSLKGGDNALSFNGALPTTSAIPTTLPTVYDSLRLYDINNQSAGHPTVWISALQYYPVRKSNQFMSVTTAL